MYLFNLFLPLNIAHMMIYCWISQAKQFALNNRMLMNVNSCFISFRNSILKDTCIPISNGICLQFVYNWQDHSNCLKLFLIQNFFLIVFVIDICMGKKASVTTECITQWNLILTNSIHDKYNCIVCYGKDSAAES